MNPFLSQATLTSKGQTTIPLPVRQVLGLKNGDKINFVVSNGGVVQVERAADGEPRDSVVGAYLTFLEQDMISRPSKLSVLQRDEQLAKLLSEVEIEEFPL